jgi:hypothetical protein
VQPAAGAITLQNTPPDMQKSRLRVRRQPQACRMAGICGWEALFNTGETPTGNKAEDGSRVRARLGLRTPRI